MSDHKNNDDFLKLLRQKLEKKPSEDFEKRFWSDFDREFSQKESRAELSKKSSLSFWQKLSEFFDLKPVLAFGVPAMALILAIFYWPSSEDSSKNGTQNNQATIAKHSAQGTTHRETHKETHREESLKIEMKGEAIQVADAGDLSREDMRMLMEMDELGMFDESGELDSFGFFEELGDDVLDEDDWEFLAQEVDA